MIYYDSSVSQNLDTLISPCRSVHISEKKVNVYAHIVAESDSASKTSLF